MTKHALKLKPLPRQVIVITGATSGIGLSTARAAAAEGAGLVLAARNEEALKSVCDDLTAKGARCAYVVADVGLCEQVQALADFAIAEFGGFDTWVNNAGVSILGPIVETPLEDQRRLFDTNYWGVVYGSRVAVEHLRTREGGGAVINLGSPLGDVAAPGQGVYSASKFAVKAFTQALQYELAGQGWPVSVTLIKPQAVDSPYAEHARNLTSLAVESASGGLRDAAGRPGHPARRRAPGARTGRGRGRRAPHRPDRRFLALGGAAPAGGLDAQPEPRADQAHRHARRQSAPPRPRPARAGLPRQGAPVQPGLQRPDAAQDDPDPGRPGGHRPGRLAAPRR